MGWVSYHRVKGETDRAHFERELLSDPDYEIVQCASKNRVFYAAVRTNSTGEVWALVVLMHWTRGPSNFAYKDLDETMGPAEANAPAAVLDALTPTDNDDALEWRGRCRANLVRHTAVRERLRDVTNDTVIRTATPLRFENGMQTQLFRCVHRAGSMIRWHAITDDGSQFPCRLGARWAVRYSWTIVPSGTTDAHAASQLDQHVAHRPDEVHRVRLRVRVESVERRDSLLPRHPPRPLARRPPALRGAAVRHLQHALRLPTPRR